MTDTSTQSITAWLTECLDADQAVARAAMPGGFEEWVGARDDHAAVMDVAIYTFDIRPSPIDDAHGRYRAVEWRAHIALHDPARVLAQVAAMRAIVDEHSQGVTVLGSVCFTCATDDNAGDLIGEWPCTTIRALASIYADRPGYDEAWRA